MWYIEECGSNSCGYSVISCVYVQVHLFLINGRFLFALLRTIEFEKTIVSQFLCI